MGRRTFGKVVCHGCFRVCTAPLCRECFSDLRPAPDRVLPGGVRAIAAFDHTGIAARLVHGFKYRGDELLADLASAALAGRIHAGMTFVPVPRVWTRLIRYGVDPAARFADGLASATGGSVEMRIRRPFHTVRRAGSDHESGATPFRASSGLQGETVVVDDVLTTGATVIEAIRALEPARPRLVVTATSARGVSSLLVPAVGSHAGEMKIWTAGDSDEFSSDS
jgi:predicted amidophosphoribosyltransferase